MQTIKPTIALKQGSDGSMHIESVTCTCGKPMRKDDERKAFVCETGEHEAPFYDPLASAALDAEKD